VPELIAAVKWAGDALKNADDLVKSPSPLPLSAINDATPEGKQLLSSARQILNNLARKDLATISVEDTVDTAKIFAQTAFNGDGIVPADAIDRSPLDVATLRDGRSDVRRQLRKALPDRDGPTLIAHLPINFPGRRSFTAFTPSR